MAMEILKVLIILNYQDLIKFNILGQIKTILPLNYIEYDEKKVIEELQKNFDWINYGGHHHESLLTKFVVSYYLPKKFGIDRRRTGISAMIRSKKITREMHWIFYQSHQF